MPRRLDPYANRNLPAYWTFFSLPESDLQAAKKSRLACNFGGFLLLLAALLLFAIGAPAADDPFPKPGGAVNDFAGVIAAPDSARMENLSRELLAKTGTAVVVAAVKTTGGIDPDDYVNRLYQAWGIGRKGEDKGVLILLAMKERRVRIETGYGVEGFLPDGLVGEILDRYALPRFKEGDYSGGLAETMAALASLIAKDAGVSLDGAPPMDRKTSRSREKQGIFPLLFLLAAAFFLLGTRRGRAMLPWILLLTMSGGGRHGGGGFGSFGGGGFGGFGGGMSGGGGAGRGF